MKILIYATAAEMGGAITILNQYYEKAKQTNDDYIFILSKPKLEETKNIKTLNYDYIKKNWLLRIYFYWFTLPKLVKEIDPKRIISLNNTMISRINYHQTIYLHQPLPFFKNRFNLFTETYLWIVKNIIGTLIKYSLRRVEMIIVQSNWLKKRIVNQLKIPSNKIVVEVPTIDFNFKSNSNFSYSTEKIRFIYPAGYTKYKNHQLIIDALKYLEKAELEKIEIKFTLFKEESKPVIRMARTIKTYNLPIYLVGYLKKEEVFALYSDHFLVFPSEIETFGLPLLEAKMSNTIILALNSDFSKEICNNYDEVYYFENSYTLAHLIKYFISEKIIRFKD